MTELALKIGEDDMQKGFQKLLQEFDSCSNSNKSVQYKVALPQTVLCHAIYVSGNGTSPSTRKTRSSGHGQHVTSLSNI